MIPGGKIAEPAFFPLFVFITIRFAVTHKSAHLIKVIAYDAAE
jgi:hypothetical protein